MADKADTKFKPGQSGNPTGRKPGSGVVGQARQALLKAWDGEKADGSDGIRQKLIELAKGGDLTAIRLVAERVAPALKAVEPPVAMQMTGDSLTAKAYSVLAAMGEGALAPSQAAQLLTALGQVAKVLEVDELLRRIEALEAKGK